MPHVHDDEDGQQVNSVTPKRILVRAKHIKDAYEHLDGSHQEYACLLFVGEDCIGIDTEDRTHRRISYERKTEASAGPRAYKSRLSDITPDRVLAVLQEHGDLPTEAISNELKIGTKDHPKRQRVVRVVKSLVASGAVVMLKENLRYPRYHAVEDAAKLVKPMQVRRQRKPTSATSASITEEGVLEVLRRHGQPMLSRDIADDLGIGRKESSKRVRVSYWLKKLVDEKQARVAGKQLGYRLYEAVKVEQAATA